MPAAIAALRAGAIALGSSAETTMALTFCWVSVWMKGTWAAPVASEGPTCLNVPLSAVAASCPPDAATSKYGLLTAFGRKAMLSVTVAVPDGVLLPPQAVMSSTASDSAVAPNILDLNSEFLLITSTANRRDLVDRHHTPLARARPRPNASRPRATRFGATTESTSRAPKIGRAHVCT